MTENSERPERPAKRKPSGWFDFKGADAAFDEWVGGIRRELKETDKRFDEYMKDVDRKWGLRK